MKYSLSHKRILSALLLLLYTFIAAPVQLWHHHNPSSAKQLSKLTIGKAGINAQTQECKICQHTYTDYADDAFTFNAGTSLLHAGINNVSIPHYKFLLLVSPGNKSPPVAWLIS